MDRPFDKKEWYSLATGGHEHEDSHCTKSHNFGPIGCFSDEFERLQNRNKQTGWYQHGQDQECDEDELFAVKGKGGFKGT